MRELMTGEPRPVVLTLPLAEVGHDGHGNGRLVGPDQAVWLRDAEQRLRRRLPAHVGAQAGGYVWLPRGTTVRVRIEAERGKQRVAEVLEIDLSTARPGENAPILRKPKT